MEIFNDKFRVLIEAALQEDIGDGDHSTLSCISPDLKGKAVLKIKDNGLLAGVKVVLCDTLGEMPFFYAASDVAIVEFRRTMVKAVQGFMSGEPAIGTTESRGPRPGVRACEGIIPKAADWMTLGTEEATPAAQGVAAE